MRLTFEGIGQVTEIRDLKRKDGTIFGTSVKVAHGTGVVDLSLDTGHKLKLPPVGEWVEYAGKIEPDYAHNLRFRPSAIAVLSEARFIEEMKNMRKAGAA